jgi:hypothetical protein
MSKVYKRKLSDSERLWLGVNEVFPPFVNQIILEGHGNIDYTGLCHAVEAASAANPGSRLVLKGFLSKCYWVDSGITPPVRIADGENWDGRSSDNAPFLKINLPYKGPTCEVVYITGKITRIAFRSNHGVMDARGMLCWMEDVFRVLRGETPIGSLSTITDYELIESISDKKKKLDNIQSIAPTGKAGKKAKGSTWKRITVTGNQSKIIARIAIALSKSAWKYQTGRFNIAIPVDLRRRMEGLRSTANLSNTIFYEITKDSTSESMAKNLQEQIENKNDCINIERGYNVSLIPIWLIALTVRIISRIVLNKNLFIIPICISNVGRMDSKIFCTNGFIADSFFSIPLCSDRSPAFVVTTGMSGKIEILVCVPNLVSDNGRLDKLMDDIKNVFM